MKKTLLILAAALTGLYASAQSYLLNNPDNTSYFGVRASVDVSCPTSNPHDMYKNGAGFSIGAVYNTPIVANLYFEPGLTLYYNTWSVKKGVQLFEDINMTKGSFRNFGMSIPLMFGYHFDFTPDTKLMVFTGPEVKVGFVNDLHYEGIGEGYEIKDYIGMYGDYGLYDRVDCAWKFGVGLTYMKYYIGVTGSLSMINLYNDTQDSASFHQKTVLFTLGYNF